MASRSGMVADYPLGGRRTCYRRVVATTLAHPLIWLSALLSDGNVRVMVWVRMP